jgi:hypothetical protein
MRESRKPPSFIVKPGDSSLSLRAFFFYALGRMLMFSATYNIFKKGNHPKQAGSFRMVTKKGARAFEGNM